MPRSEPGWRRPNCLRSPASFVQPKHHDAHTLMTTGRPFHAANETYFPVTGSRPSIPVRGFPAPAAVDAAIATTAAATKRRIAEQLYAAVSRRRGRARRPRGAADPRGGRPRL